MHDQPSLLLKSPLNCKFTPVILLDMPTLQITFEGLFPGATPAVSPGYEPSESQQTLTSHSLAQTFDDYCTRD